MKRYYAFTFFTYFSLFAAVLIPFFTKWAGISLFQAQILQSWFMFWTFVLEIPTGVVADKFGRKYSLFLGTFIASFAALIYGSFPRFEILLLGEFLFAAAFAFISGANEALLYDWLKKDNKENQSKIFFGRVKSISLTSMMVSAPIGGFIAYNYDLNVPMQLTAIPFFIAAVIALTFKEPGILSKESESTRYLNIVKNGLSFLYHHKKVKIIAIDSIFVSTAAYFVIWLYQPLLQNIGIAIFYFGFIHAILLLSEIAVSSNFEFLEKLAGSPKSLLKIGALVTGLSFMLVAFFQNLITILIFVVIAGGIGLTRETLMSAYMNKFIPSQQRATVLSSISMFRRFGLVLLNPIIGFTADRSLGLALFFVGLLPLYIFLFSPIKHETLTEE